MSNFVPKISGGNARVIPFIGGRLSPAQRQLLGAWAGKRLHPFAHDLMEKVSAVTELRKPKDLGRATASQIPDQVAAHLVDLADPSKAVPSAAWVLRNAPKAGQWQINNLQRQGILTPEQSKQLANALETSVQANHPQSLIAALLLLPPKIAQLFINEHNAFITACLKAWSDSLVEQAEKDAAAAKEKALANQTIQAEQRHANELARTNKKISTQRQQRAQAQAARDQSNTRWDPLSPNFDVALRKQRENDFFSTCAAFAKTSDTADVAPLSRVESSLGESFRSAPLAQFGDSMISAGLMNALDLPDAVGVGLGAGLYLRSK